MPYTELTPSHQRRDTSTEDLLLTVPLTNNHTTNHTNTNTNTHTTTNHTPLTNDTETSSHHSVRRRGRILDRDADFYQSRGRWSGIRFRQTTGRRNRSSLSVGDHYHNRRHASCLLAIKRKIRQWLPRLWDDWFHTLAYQRTILLMLILFVTYSSIVVLFGGIYLGMSLIGSERTRQPDGSYVTRSYCGMDINDHMEALYFSLSTMATIGYGVSDYYFGGCWTPLLLVLAQVCTAITFDAVAVGLLFTRLSRGRKRSKSIVVSNQAVVQVVQGKAYFMFRVGELRRYPLMNAAVRIFCVRHERIPRVFDLTTMNHNSRPRGIPIETTYFVTRSMKILHPDETLQDVSNILMSLPQVIVHRMDDKSPLVPPPEWYDAHGHHHVFPQNKDNLMDVQSQIQEFWRDRGIEIVVLVEGLDELTGTAVQTRHSYCTSYGNSQNEEDEEGDVAWNRTFVNCILPNNPSGDDEDLELNPVCTVDFDRFHNTVHTPRDCLASPYIPY